VAGTYFAGGDPVTRSLDTADIERFRGLVAERLGLYFEDSKLDFLAETLQRRMEVNKCDHFSAYCQRLTSSTSQLAEMRAVAEQLTVCETYFFRYLDHFRALAETVVPNRMRAQDHSRQLRILSAGCASGEEAYSVAVLIRERLPELASWDIDIRGIDVNVAMLEKARRGRYTAWSLRETPADLRMKYFRAEGRDFQLHATVSSAVKFEERNLVQEDSLFWQRDAFDIVFCRNVTMYFTPEITRSIIARIAGSLRPGGFLFLGHAETLRGTSQGFHLRHTHETFYYQLREDCDGHGDTICCGASASDGPAETPLPEVLEPNDSWFSIIQRASERVTNLTEENSKTATSESENGDTKAPNSRAHPRTTVWDQTLAIELLREEKFAEATELLRALPPESKADPDAQLLLAALLTNSGQLPEAEKVCERVLSLDELNAGAHYLMALCREHAGDRSAAMEHDHAAVYLDPAFAMPHLHIGLAAKRSADVETARHELSQALTLLAREDASRMLLFGGGFSREALAEFCRTELRACGGNS
jgi:chemotaxis protein methyltransferase CheR